MIWSSLTSQRRVRVFVIGVGAAVLLLSTVLLGLYLGLETNRRLISIKTSWYQFSEAADQKGAWISEIRGLMGYGGIIHNFKNYVLRQDSDYLRELEGQIKDFFRAARAYEASLPPGPERDALKDIQDTIARYQSKIPIARQAELEEWPIIETDGLVKVDDTKAIMALERLEEIWRSNRKSSTRDIVNAVIEGERLIAIGFAFLFGLAIVAAILYSMLYALMRELQSTVVQLTDELAERQRAEQAEKKLSRAIEQSPATIIITDTNGRIEYVNRRFETLTEYDRSEIIGETPRFLRSGDKSTEVYARLWEQLLKGEEWHGIFRNRKKSGDHYWTETNILPLKDDDGAIINFIGIGEDITEKRKARDQVVRAQKMEAVGLLAGGIAHDFNNILTSILGNVHLARLDAPEESDFEEELVHIELAAKRAQSLVRQLLTFARRQPAAPARLRLANAIEEDLKLLRASIPVTVELKFSTDNPEITVLVDANQLHQVVMNLCRNAAEAIGTDQGIIKITVSDIDQPIFEEQTPELREISKADIAGNERWARLSIVDDGPGMAEEVAQRVFEPFYSTKPVGKGTGLGLSMVSTLIKEMGGRITLDTAPGKGADFSIYIPQCDPIETADEKHVPLPGGRERLMLIDDEVDVVSTYRRILIRLGYMVDAYTDPIAAMSTFRSAPGRYDALLTDLVMPEMTGADVAEEAHRLRADIPILICTGYQPQALEIQEHPKVRVLEKPVDPAGLARTLRAMLESSDSPLPAPENVT